MSGLRSLKGPVQLAALLVVQVTLVVSESAHFMRGKNGNANLPRSSSRNTSKRGSPQVLSADEEKLAKPSTLAGLQSIVNMMQEADTTDTKRLTQQMSLVNLFPRLSAAAIRPGHKGGVSKRELTAIEREWKRAPPIFRNSFESPTARAAWHMWEESWFLNNKNKKKRKTGILKRDPLKESGKKSAALKKGQQNREGQGGKKGGKKKQAAAAGEQYSPLRVQLVYKKCPEVKSDTEKELAKWRANCLQQADLERVKNEALDGGAVAQVTLFHMNTVILYCRKPQSQLTVLKKVKAMLKNKLQRLYFSAVEQGRTFADTNDEDYGDSDASDCAEDGGSVCLRRVKKGPGALGSKLGRVKDAVLGKIPQAPVPQSFKELPYWRAVHADAALRHVESVDGGALLRRLKQVPVKVAVYDSGIFVEEQPDLKKGAASKGLFPHPHPWGDEGQEIMDQASEDHDAQKRRIAYMEPTGNHGTMVAGVIAGPERFTMAHHFILPQLVDLPSSELFMKKDEEKGASRPNSPRGADLLENSASQVNFS